VKKRAGGKDGGGSGCSDGGRGAGCGRGGRSEVREKGQESMDYK